MHYFGKVCDKHPEADGLRYISCRKCVPCHNVVAAQNRRNTIKIATPPWADLKEIRRIYKRASKSGKMVDHVIPLNHPKVCGLHVPWNLRVVDKLKNLSKGNKFRVLTLKGIKHEPAIQLRASDRGIQQHVWPAGEPGAAADQQQAYQRLPGHYPQGGYRGRRNLEEDAAFGNHV